jgi:hypothetical protein
MLCHVTQLLLPQLMVKACQVQQAVHNQHAQLRQ